MMVKNDPLVVAFCGLGCRLTAAETEHIHNTTDDIDLIYLLVLVGNSQLLQQAPSSSDLTNAADDESAKLYNHGEGPSQGLLLVESFLPWVNVNIKVS